MRKYGCALLLFVCILILDKHFHAYMPEKVSGMYIAGFLLFSYYFLLYLAARAAKLNPYEDVKKHVVGICLLSLCSLFFLIHTASQDQTIYVYDNLETWEPAVHVSSQVFMNPYEAVRDLMYSINHEDYNRLIPMLISIPMHFIGFSFVHYISYIWLLFGIPSVILLSLMVQSWIFDIAGYRAPLLIILLVNYCIPSLMFPVLGGYANVSILLPVCILLALLLGLKRHHSMPYSVLISAMSVLSVLQARTAAYAVVGCFFGYTLYCIYQGYRANDFKQICIFLIKQYLAIAVISVAAMLLFFRPFFIHTLTYDIGTAYSAYTLGADFLTRLLAASHHLGIVLNTIGVVALVCGVCTKALRPYMAMLVGWIIIGAMLFCKVQLMGVQHVYIVILPMMILISGLCGVMLDRNKPIAIGLVFFVILNLAQAFFHMLAMEWSVGHGTQIRCDISAIKDMVSDLQTEAEKNQEKIYFLSSSANYNHNTLSKCNFPEQANAIPNMMITADVDLRDGFPVHFFDADIILVADPIQTHLRYEDQSIVTLLAEDMLSQNLLSRHYRYEKEYLLSVFKPIDNCEPNDSSVVHIKVYHKISPLEKTDIDFVQGQFEAIYPEQPNLFRERFERYKQEHL